MPRDKKSNMKIHNSNKHLLDVFSDDLYLELGSIDYDPLNDLLNKKIVDFTKFAYPDIINNGLGAMRCDSEELSYKLPFLRLQNLVEKNKAYQLVLTYGLLLRRKGYKEYFSPIVLIPVRLYFENDSILFQMIGKPMINPQIQEEVEKDEAYEVKIDSIENIDKFINLFLKSHTSNVRSEHYLTIMSLTRPEINIRHEKYSLDNEIDSRLIDNYTTEKTHTYYNITHLDRTQRRILATANAGNSFAIKGQEGSGKTTTLINVCTDAIKNDKRVLYISNNDYTLKTVNDVFTQNKLDKYVSDFTQSFPKINQKHIEEKEEVLFTTILYDEIDAGYQVMANLGNDYASKIKNYLLIDIMKEIILTPKPDELFDEKIMKNAYKLYRHEIEEVVEALGNIEKEMVKMPSFINSHFINIPITHNIKDYKEPLNLIQDIYLNYSVLNKEKKILEKTYGFSNITDYALFINIIKDYEKLNKARVPLPWYEITDESKENIKEKFGNFIKAKELYTKIENELEIHRSIEETIEKEYTNKLVNFDVKNAIKTITDKYFDIKDEKIDKFLKNYVSVNEDLDKALIYCNELESNFAKMKARLELSIDLSKTEIINQVLDFIYVLDKGYFAKAWCDYDNRDGIYKKMCSIENALDKYEESIKMHNKFFDNIENINESIRIVEKKNKDENSKYKKTPIKDVLDALYYIKEYKDKVNIDKQTYREITNTDYKYNFKVSPIFKEFIDKHHNINDKDTRIHIEESFQDLRGSGVLDVLSLAKELRKNILNVNVSYDSFAHYTLINGAKNLTEKIDQIRGIKKYIKKVVECQKEMTDVLKNKKESILIQDYLTLLNNLNSRKSINDKINSNHDYAFLYGPLFKGEETSIEEIKLFINDFDLYTNIFKNPNCLVKSFQPLYNGEIVAHLEESNKTIKIIGEFFKGYVKIFKTNISKFYYDDFDKITKYFFELLNSVDELRTYLSIADQMKVLLKYKLFNLNNFIIYNNHELVKERFKYSYFIKLYNDFKEKNPNFTNNKEYENIMDAILVLEGDHISNNIEVLRANTKKIKSDKSKNLNYNQYIEKNKYNKRLFLCDTQIANQYINVDLFDLVIIDDAHLLNANEYYKVINAKQVIISGSDQVQTSLNNNLISRIRSSNIIKLKYKYKQTPLNLLNQFDDIKGRFYTSVEMNKGITVTSEDYNDVLIDLFRNDINSRINFYTSSLSIMQDLMKNVSVFLYDKNISFSSIYDFYRYNLNVSDLSNGYSIDSEYNIIHLESYHDINDKALTKNMLNDLLSCGKKLVIIDPKKRLQEEKQTEFIKKLNEVINYQIPKYEFCDNDILALISKSLSRFQIKTKLLSDPLHMVVEYDNKYYGIMILENPSTTEFTFLNEYREFKSNSLPIVIVWLSNLVDNYSKTINEIVREIRS